MQRLRACGAYFGSAQELWQVNQRLVSGTVSTSCAPAVVYRILSDLEERGKGRRVSKVVWQDNTFWHIVDVTEHPRSTSAAEQRATASEEQPADGGEEQASEDVAPAAKEKPPPKLPSVFAIKFVDGAPTTGRVVKLKQIFKREWRLLPQQ